MGECVFDGGEVRWDWTAKQKSHEESAMILFAMGQEQFGRSVFSAVDLDGQT